ncbi:MAG: hypothetical protein Q7S76_00995 [bacterium]|nr:hypothetical protein [bacterium]
MRRLIRIFSRFAPFIILALVIIELVVTNSFVSLSDHVSGVEKEIQRVERENDDLTQKIASASSLLAIEEKAKTMGFSKTSRYMTIHQDEFLVSLHQVRP